MEKKDRNTIEGSNATKNDETINNSEKLLVLPLGDESKKITQVITNDTARQIMGLLAEHSMSASHIANQLKVPLTTVKYNLENLVNVGLAKIERIKYSEKGRQVKIYAPVRKLIVVVPEKADSTSIVDILKKYLGVIIAAIFASGFIELLTGPFSSDRKIAADSLPSYVDSTPSHEFILNVSESPRDVVVGLTNNTVHESFSNNTIPLSPPYISETLQKSAETPANAIGTIDQGSIQQTIDISSTFHLGLWFLFGCLFMIILVIFMDYYRQNH